MTDEGQWLMDPEDLSVVPELPRRVPDRISAMLLLLPCKVEELSAWLLHGDHLEQFGSDLLQVALQNLLIPAVRILLQMGVDPNRCNAMDHLIVFYNFKESLFPSTKTCINLLCSCNASCYMTHVDQIRWFVTEQLAGDDAIVFADELKHLILEKLSSIRCTLKVLDIFPSVIDILLLSFLFGT